MRIKMPSPYRPLLPTFNLLAWTNYDINYNLKRKNITKLSLLPKKY